MPDMRLLSLQMRGCDQGRCLLGLQKTGCEVHVQEEIGAKLGLVTVIFRHWVCVTARATVS